MPDISAAREGLHAGAAQCALAKLTPRLASRSMCGVLTSGLPPRCPTQSFRSSIAMKRISDLDGCAAHAPEIRARATMGAKALMTTMEAHPHPDDNAQCRAKKSECSQGRKT